MLSRSTFVFLIASLFAHSQASAQESISQGKHFIGGGINFNTSDNSNKSGTSNNTDQDNLILSFSPYVGKFVKDGTAIGLQLNTSYSNFNTTYLSNGVANSVTERN